MSAQNSYVGRQSESDLICVPENKKRVGLFHEGSDHICNHQSLGVSGGWGVGGRFILISQILYLYLYIDPSLKSALVTNEQALVLLFRIFCQEREHYRQNSETKNTKKTKTKMQPCIQNDIQETYSKSHMFILTVVCFCLIRSNNS